MTTYIKTPVSEKSEPPYQFGERLTPHQEGRLVGYKEGYEAALALFKPVPAEAISLEEAKEKVAHKYGAPSWTRLIGSFWAKEFNHKAFEEVLLEAAELYLSQNTAALREELEQLKANDKAGILVSRELADNIHNTLRERDQLQQQVKTLAEALENLIEWGNKYPSTRIYRYEDADKICKELDQVINMGKEALSSINQ